MAVSQQMITTFFYGNRNANYHLGTGLFAHKGTRSVVKIVKLLLMGCRI
jgi:hypothetical protein